MPTLEISWSSLWRILLAIVLVAALYLTREVLVVIFLSIIISSGFDAPVSFLEKKRIPRILSTLGLFLLVLAVLAFILYALVPITIFELKDFLDNLSNLNLPVFGSFDFSQFAKKLDQELGNLAAVLLSGGISLFNFIAAVFGNVVLIITTAVLSFYLTINRAGVEQFLRAVLPVTHEEYVIDLYHRVRKKLGRWLQGQIILMLMVGTIVSFGLWILGVKYSFVLGLLAGILELVPVVGPIFAGSLSFLVAITDSFLLGLYAVLFFIVVQQMENHLLVPLIMKRAIGINPVIVVIALLAGAQVAGFIGVVLAVPVAVVLQELVEDWEKRKGRVRGSRLEL